jgi:hypothetical protein
VCVRAQMPLQDSAQARGGKRRAASNCSAAPSSTTGDDTEALTVRASIALDPASQVERDALASQRKDDVT